uniref:Uncharacterized protein n=1 Tax=Anguilla anguilla TaxID=7936 RepID=A0A0E9TG85_ANGAN
MLYIHTFNQQEHILDNLANVEMTHSASLSLSFSIKSHMLIYFASYVCY